uniref:Proteasome activator PA28 C-terminal domain-containing protein n=1 Tax=Glossina pallidipes TaxID=7398 RepID=A0A1A9Z4D1_GLOPL
MNYECQAGKFNYFNIIIKQLKQLDTGQESTYNVKRYYCKLQDYKDCLIKKAEQVITQGFPEKIIQLNELLATPMSYERTFSDVHQHLNIPVPDPDLVNNNDAGDDYDQPAKRPRTESTLVSGVKITDLPTGSVTCNASLCEIIEIIKPIIHKLVEDLNFLKMWIFFMIPKIEDGNDFEDSIEAIVLDEIETVQTEAVPVFDQISIYFLSHANLVAKVEQYPHIDDYRRAVVELDEKKYLDLLREICELLKKKRDSINETNSCEIILEF